ncbi:MAG: hypothetical protein QOF76_4957, partial [Solirubrobacteraceae bacterium]|nr:hypothetical protein [Solirubrobacteraceae bacterium]
LGASPESVAAQLLLAPPHADPWVVDRLREAAAVAQRRGAPDAALALLERAQAEPPPPEQQAALALQLGASAAFVRGPAGVEPLRRAYEELTDPEERGRAAVRLSHLLLFVSSPQEGVALAQRAADELPPGLHDLREGLLAIGLIGNAFGVDSAPAPLDALRAGPRGSGPGARSLTAMASFVVAMSGGPAEDAAALAREALDSDSLDGFEVTAPVALGGTVLTLTEPGEGLRAMERYAAHAAKLGEILGQIGADLWGGYARIWAGDLPGALAWLERAHEGELLWGTKLDAVMGYSAAFTALAELERGDIDAAWTALQRVDAGHGTSDGARQWLSSWAALCLATEQYDEALALSHRLEGVRPPDSHPLWDPWRGLRAPALLALGRPDEAFALAEEELAVAQRVAAPWVVGRQWRLLADLQGRDGANAARQAIALLKPSSARLQLAHAYAALWRALERGAEAEAARQSALTLARACGAGRLAEALAAGTLPPCSG